MTHTTVHAVERVLFCEILMGLFWLTLSRDLRRISALLNFCGCFQMNLCVLAVSTDSCLVLKNFGSLKLSSKEKTLGTIFRLAAATQNRKHRKLAGALRETSYPMAAKL